MPQLDTRHTARHGLGLAIAFALTSWSCAALAQTAANASEEKTPERANTQPSATLEAVTVTAQKRTENARKVPASISVVSEQQLENQHVTQLADLNGYLPAMTITDRGTPGQTAVSLRGIPTLGPGAVVGTYLNDTPLGSSSNFARSSGFVLDLLPYDIQRVEVLRGPQGTLYGAGAMGGLLKYVLKDPDLDSFEGRVGGGVSSIDGAGGNGWNVRAGVNAPLVEGRLALRASFANEFTPGWVDNAYTGRKDINDTRQRSGHVSLLWQASDDVSVKFTGLHQTVDADDNSLSILDANRRPRFGLDGTDKPASERFEKKVDFFAATVDWNLQWADFVSATSYSRTKTYQLNDQSKTYGPLFPLFGAPEGVSTFPLSLDLKKWTQEFRLASKSDERIEWMLGAFYTHETSANHQELSARSFAGVPVAGLDPLAIVDLPSTYKERALFGNLTYKFSERFDITAGLRYASNDQDFKQIATAGSLLELGTTTGQSSEDVATYLLGARWHLDNDSLLYARIASGYRPGGPNVALPGVPPSVDSDSLVNYEFGWKSLFLDQRASIDLAAFLIDWKDIQLSASTQDGLTYSANGGKARSRGVELTSAFKLTPNLRVGFNGSFTDASLREDAPSLKGLSGDTLPGIPRWTAALSADYDFQWGAGFNGHVGAGYQWIGKRKTNVDHNPNAAPLPASGQLNLNADVSRDNWTLRLYLRNLTNERDITSLGPVTSATTGAIVEWQANRIQPRTVGLEFDVWF
ncbi:tonB dependent receptor family protein [Lysobacter capsici]|uniref:TonB-dependent receptor n=1 Tax=Lysobacter capsici TaxID=435897 RepID=UPI0007166770|nr:TonB-dependent receptor [Lysobacter capsici]ALN86897.1 tonB dependent receptor family protein [Lysobacter capsici]